MKFPRSFAWVLQVARSSAPPLVNDAEDAGTPSGRGAADATSSEHRASRRHGGVTDGGRGGTWTQVPQPWERTDKGKQWPNSGSFGRERESERAWAWPWEKSGNPPGEAALTRQGETYGG